MQLTRVLLSEFKYFKRYVEKEMLKDRYSARFQRIRGWKVIGRRRQWYYDENRPWTSEFKENNRLGDAKNPVPVEPIKEFNLFKGDRVEILVGRDKGKQGIINCIIKERNWCFIEGLNLEFKMQSFGKGQPPTCIRDERPLLVNRQVALIDPGDEKPTSVEWRYTEKGERVRVSTRSGRIIPLPDQAHELEDGVLPSVYKANKENDTSPKQLTEVTFRPQVINFEKDIMDALGIQEDRKRAKTYWY